MHYYDRMQTKHALFSVDYTIHATISITRTKLVLAVGDIKHKITKTACMSGVTKICKP